MKIHVCEGNTGNGNRGVYTEVYAESEMSDEMLQLGYVNNRGRRAILKALNLAMTNLDHLQHQCEMLIKENSNDEDIDNLPFLPNQED